MTSLVTFEGTDYTGKTETAKLVVDILSRNHSDIRYNSGILHPCRTSEQLETMAREADSQQKELLYTMAFLMDAELDAYIGRGVLVVQDRYWPSVVAWGRFLNEERSIHRVMDKNQLFLQPVATIHLTCSYKEKAKRFEKREFRSPLDKALMSDPLKMSTLEDEISTVLRGLSNVKLIDTTDLSQEETADEVIRFLRGNHLVNL
ncbi:MAG TPA: hypothetical protein VJG90_00090 [Candidatus Nanoarchaeia archaeon]|nr:hypothetical protein [Candidatus Nanoarchaeia archaeon]